MDTHLTMIGYLLKNDDINSIANKQLMFFASTVDKNN
jgi:hypothetical protein